MTEETSIQDYQQQRREAEAQIKAAQKAIKEAEERAAQAKAEADRRSKIRAGEYLAMLEREQAERRKAALQRQAQAKTAFEDVIAGESSANVFAAYRELIRAKVSVWGIETELADARQRLRGVYKEPRPVSLSFADDLAEIINHLILTEQDEQLEAIRDRARKFMRGEDTSAKEAAA